MKCIICLFCSFVVFVRGDAQMREERERVGITLILERFLADGRTSGEDKIQKQRRERQQ